MRNNLILIVGPPIESESIIPHDKQEQSPPTTPSINQVTPDEIKPTGSETKPGGKKFFKFF